MKHLITFLTLSLLCSSCSELKYSKIDQKNFVRYYYAQSQSFSKALFLYNYKEADSLARCEWEKGLAKILKYSFENKSYDAYLLAKDIRTKYKNDTIDYYTKDFIRKYETSFYVKDMYSVYGGLDIDSSKICKVIPPKKIKFSKSDTIPFELVDGLPIIKVTINSKTYSMIWDCGSANSMCNIDTNDVETYNGEYCSEFIYTKDTVRERVAFAKCLLLGKISINDLFFSFCDSKLNLVNGKQHDGIIGWDIIKYFDNIIDFENKRLILTKIDADSTIRSKYINFFYYDRPMFLVYSLSGVPLYFHYDSGCNYSSVTNDYLKTFKINSNSLKSKKVGFVRSVQNETIETSMKYINQLDFVLFDDLVSLRKDVITENETISVLLTHGRIGNDCFYGKALHFNIAEGVFEVLD